MRCGLWHLLRCPEPWVAKKEYPCWWNCVEQSAEAEALGFATLWLTAQHCIPAWSLAGAPEGLRRALSQRTAASRLGIAVVMSPMYHPLHTAVQRAGELGIGGVLHGTVGPESGGQSLRTCKEA